MIIRQKLKRNLSGNSGSNFTKIFSIIRFYQRVLRQIISILEKALFQVD